MIKKEYRRYIDLVYLLTLKQVTLKYKRTVLGFAWSLMNPMLQAVIYFFAFKVVMRFQIEHYTLFLLSALFPWTWFSTSILMSTNVFVENVSLIRKIRFPRETLVIAVVLAEMMNFFCALPILGALVLLYDVSIGPQWLIGLPLLIVIQFFTVTGISLVLATVNAYFRDMQYIVGVAINMLFWVTPIIYPLESVPEKFAKYFVLNPVAPLMAAWRKLFLESVIDWPSVGMAALVSIVVFLVSFRVFVALNRKIDEVL